ncbi:hypothetical protein ACU7RR_003512 [Providencia stuartii]|nr:MULTISPECIES: hypothetical protein [Providencia]MDE8745786.1 hypothetical protein [Providencia thailandensis]MDE8764461.1 hypothetical protein [Providencia thailandensis]MDE8776487.1 hypothetical protein [Providencia thailandensis]MDE8780474.1 hypothetical protein [Providencia thailandensis]MDE8784948.1 hypothetical protein [Providencia thailandensis]
MARQKCIENVLAQMKKFELSIFGTEICHIGRLWISHYDTDKR